MGASVYRITATGAGAVATVATVPVGQCYRLLSVAAHFDVAPAAAGSLTVTLDAADGSDYDVLLQTASMVGLTDYVWIPDQDVCIVGSDAIKVAYANPNSRVYGVRITLKAV
jgi:hypothetical protein